MREWAERPLRGAYWQSQGGTILITTSVQKVSNYCSHPWASIINIRVGVIVGTGQDRPGGKLQ